MRENIIQIWNILEKHNRTRLVFCLFLVVTSSVFDMIGVISILPFLSILSNPEILNSNYYLIEINKILNFTSTEFILFLGVSSMIIISINQALRFYSTQYAFEFMNNIYFEKSGKLLSYYLSKPYKFIFSKSVPVLIQRCTDTLNAATNYMHPVLFIFGNIMTCFFITSFLLIYNPILTIILFFTLVFFYFLIYKRVRDKVQKLGTFSEKYISSSAKIIGNAFGAFKEIKIANNSKGFIDKYQAASLNHRDAQNKNQIYQFAPSYLVEVFAFVNLLIITIYLFFSSNNFSELITIIGVLAISLKRLLPAIQNIYAQNIIRKYYHSIFDSIIGDLTDCFKYYEKNFQKENKKKRKIEFKNNLILNKVRYVYKKRETKKFEFSTVINKGQFIGICGESGNGKTTFLDLITGLLNPRSGELYVDNEKVTLFNSKIWHDLIAYVPQNGFILDDSIENNIKFGIKKSKSKYSINKICSFTQINNFIVKNLPNKYKTKLGEKGTKLSGGQQQRLLIARALYKNPKILILDEATNALDYNNEKNIIQQIRKNYKDLTILYVTHRVNTLKKCDKILLISNKKIKAEGNYNFLIKHNRDFKTLEGFYNKKYNQHSMKY